MGWRFWRSGHDGEGSLGLALLADVFCGGATLPSADLENMAIGLG